MSKNSSIKYDVVENQSDVDVEISPIEKTLLSDRFWYYKETRTYKFCHKISICYPKGTKFNSSLTTKQDLIADIYWDNDGDNDRYSKVVSARIRGIDDAAFTFEWCSSSAEHININASSEDGLDDDWEWDASGRDETVGYSEFDFDESIMKWLSELVKED